MSRISHNEVPALVIFIFILHLSYSCYDLRNCRYFSRENKTLLQTNLHSTRCGKSPRPCKNVNLISCNEWNQTKYNTQYLIKSFSVCMQLLFNMSALSCNYSFGSTPETLYCCTKPFLEGFWPILAQGNFSELPY